MTATTAQQDAPIGRVEVEGEVVSTKWTEGRFPAHKMMVEANTGYSGGTSHFLRCALRSPVNWSRMVFRPLSG